MSINNIFLNKMIVMLKKHGKIKESNFIENIFTKPILEIMMTCPICQDTQHTDPECVLCDGTGEIISVVDDDEDDKKVNEELKIK